MSEIDSVHSHAQSHDVTPERLRFGDLSGIISQQPISSEVRGAIDSIAAVASSAVQMVASAAQPAPAQAPMVTADLAEGAPLWTPDGATDPLGIRLTALTTGLHEAKLDIKDLQNGMEQLRTVVHQPHQRIDELDTQLQTLLHKAQSGPQGPGVQYVQLCSRRSAGVSV